ncbi:MAG: methyl-accepting chemotaxis protein [Bdellovibrio sp.]|nr:methyl-accepting chemotaxis protein [Bdellovibrio sp.]
MKKTQAGFQTKLSIGFSTIALFSMVVCGLTIYHFTSSIVQELSLNDLQNQIKAIEPIIQISYNDNLERQTKLINYWAKKVVASVEIRDDLVEKLAGENQVTHEKTMESVPSILASGKKVDFNFVDNLAAESGEAVTLFVRTNSGIYRALTSVKKADGSRNVGTYIPESSPVFKTLVKGERYIGRAQVAGVWYITAYEPIMKNNQLAGAFFMGTPETSYTKIKDYLKSQKILQSGYFFILDSSGKMISHPTLEGENVLAIKDVNGTEIFKEIIEKKTGKLDYTWLVGETKTPQEKMALFRYFPEMDWYVSASLSVAEAQAPLQRLKWILFFIAAAMTVAMAISTVLFGQRVVKQLGAILVGLKQSGEVVNQSSIELTSVSLALASATAEQATSVQESVTAINEISANVEKNLEATRVTENLAQDMSKASQYGQKILTDLTDKVTTIAANSELLNKEMKASHHEFERIAGVISEIGEKTKVINEIVFQTKLLSFNASVEAARAGENGKGFSVVAEEVGRLAALSGAAAEEIRNSLEQSQADVKNIISQAKGRTEALIVEAEKHIHDGVQISVECKTSFETIFKQSMKTNQAIGQISEASLEQASKIKNVNSAMVRMDNITQQNSSAAQQASQLANQLKDDSVEMAEVVHDLGSLINGSKAA